MNARMKRFFLLGGGLLCALVLQAQDMATLFANMPDPMLPQLEHAWRKDLIDLYRAGKEARLKNTMNGYSTLQKLTADYLLLQVTGRSTTEIKRLPLVNGTYVICLVETVSAPVADSRVRFFTTDWQPLADHGLFTPYPAEAFLLAPADSTDATYQDARARLDMTLVHYRLSPDSLTLRATYTTPDYLSEEDRRGVLPYVRREPLTLRWVQSRFQ